MQSEPEDVDAALDCSVVLYKDYGSLSCGSADTVLQLIEVILD